MNPIELFFSTRGRVGRGLYWACIGGWIAIDLALRGALAAVSHWSSNEALAAVFFWAWVGFSIVTYFPLTALVIKRLHDAGRSGWWTIFQHGMLACLMLVVIAVARMALGSMLMWMVLLLACSVGVLIVFVFTLLPGDDGHNEYGIA